MLSTRIALDSYWRSSVVRSSAKSYKFVTYQPARGDKPACFTDKVDSSATSKHGAGPLGRALLDPSVPYYNEEADASWRGLVLVPLSPR